MTVNYASQASMTVDCSHVFAAVEAKQTASTCVQLLNNIFRAEYLHLHAWETKFKAEAGICGRGSVQF